MGPSGNYEPALYIYLSTPGKNYGYKIKEYKYFASNKSLSFMKEYQTSYTERGGFAYVNNSKIVGIDYYQPYFETKTEIDGATTSDKSLPSGYNCHGYVPSGSSTVAVLAPKKLAFGNGYYYAIVNRSSSIDIVRLTEASLRF
ncbi:hypothetical protein [Pseudobacteroides cellulosolvens]|uniref:Uncharacterized protein n=1 Tax=Pseudobacteroides cellulosolvens ATCC 35603 = DSM 2933 TaxID=398512 RepID=A0A0L6JVF0_9FIRM|nr:hypothetical protein [Pseudobacteroides cellulosolvens]KNY29407.1 hypothetical protein Bccel_4681 [Pseudobacteroides cellulosolvens ATCC 35603 = DSM 2933]